MASQIICDLCEKPITNNDVEQYKYKLKKRYCSWERSWWSYIDVHESCRRKLFDALKIEAPPNGGSSMQND